jgi:hypothetical protein
MSKIDQRKVEELVNQKLAQIDALKTNPIAKRVAKEDVMQLREWLLMPEVFTEWFNDRCLEFKYEDIDIEGSHELCKKWFMDIEMHQCYSNSRYIALKDPSYEVYIGYIFREDNVPRPHCWLVKDNKIVDPTLGIKSTSYYDANTKLVSVKTLDGRSQFEQPDHKWAKQIEEQTGQPCPVVDWSKMYKGIIGVKIPLDFILAVTDFKEKYHQGFQNHYLFEYYLVKILGMKIKDVCIDGYGDEGHEKFMNKFRALVNNDTKCPECGLECHKPERVERHRSAVHG